ncbi:hypothetical protein APHCRT_1480 [Anaplasma phagocytophilum str. CRT53-1]|nr:hypothetical protein APHCRT_1480 [Anaplasma phagocytophilum str. CRT53-1]KJV82448.1 hypothetical protein APHHGE2_0086 [Anaplasma phagocytophilum str. HGE2]KJV85455.1 hypothetical protein APHWI1_0854 [Anaplasma phagocytophilum str. ApWI1]KJV86314.1 hypothetical protein APHNYW_1397 [Anaplasma phagocytophilum str. ApNYW]KJV99674.1 hypothetical protein OTSANNIE_0027 [Anaplasma phagocytophilum str. Annie]KKA00258.1 hypothetical protein APHDU1_0620 [Anaplasma phagocytophilum]
MRYCTTYRMLLYIFSNYVLFFSAKPVGVTEEVEKYAW